MKRILIIGGIAITTIALLVVSFIFFANYSDGIRSGNIIKFSHKGTFVKTYEGQLLMGGMNSNNDSQPSMTWEFSVDGDNEEVKKEIENALNEGYRVKIQYVEKYVQISWLGDTKYFVTKVEKVGTK